MAPIDTGRQLERGSERTSGGDSVIAILLFVLAVGAMAEVVASRGVTTTEAASVSSWQGLLQAGHEARARGDVATARRAYLIALFRARGEHSLSGMLGAVEGFRALGDREVVEQALAMTR